MWNFHFSSMFLLQLLPRFFTSSIFDCKEHELSTLCWCTNTTLDGPVKITNMACRGAVARHNDAVL